MWANLLKGWNMKVILMLIMMIISVHAAAERCENNDQALMANYEVDEFNKDKITKKTEFSFFRKNENTVMYRYPQNKISKSWHRAKNGSINSVHYFDEFKRAIEYSRSDLAPNMSQDWQGMYPMISQRFLDTMDSKIKSDECEMTYHKIKVNKSWKIVWSETLNAPIEMTLIDGDKTVRLAISEFKMDQKVVNDVFSQLNDYQSTDYADIGDNEADPFLRKMIRLGFVEHGASGFYDANGHAQKSDHVH